LGIAHRRHRPGFVPQGSAREHGHYLHDHDLNDVDNFLFFVVHGSHDGDYYHHLADHGVSDCGDSNSIQWIRFRRNK
jgi:hypothetical protein